MSFQWLSARPRLTELGADFTVQVYHQGVRHVGRRNTRNSAKAGKGTSGIFRCVQVDLGAEAVIQGHLIDLPFLIAVPALKKPECVVDVVDFCYGFLGMGDEPHRHNEIKLIPGNLPDPRQGHTDNAAVR